MEFVLVDSFRIKMVNFNSLSLINREYFLKVFSSCELF